MTNEAEKEPAGRAAAKLVRDGDIVGLGTGSTAYFAVVELGERVKAGLKMVGIPTSVATAELARAVGIPLSTLDEHQVIDITIDGADEVDPKLNLIKGGGGALLREKVIASASKKMVVVADSSKIVSALGKFPLPVEIIPFARAVVEKKIASLGASCKLRMKADGKPFVTDEGHHILDCSFGKIADPPALARTLNETPGVVEHGLFIGIAKLAIVGRGSLVVEIRPKTARMKKSRTKRAQPKDAKTTRRKGSRS
jgi:ribose 5-phosphate isomerase A